MNTPHDLSAGHPLEPPAHAVGRASVTLVDGQREGRELGVELWYPARPGGEPLTRYEVLPGVDFASAFARHGAAPAPGAWPLVLFSHGRTGTRIAYSTFCEALAARGAIVASADHPGDALLDWLGGRHVDDRTNEQNRVADAHVVLRALMHGDPAVPVGVLNAVDRQRIALVGHSYGAYTAFATAAGARGVEPHEHVRAVVGFQPYTRTMSDSLLGRMRVPALLVVAELDRVAPPDVDADRPWALLPGHPVWRLDLLGAGHQAVSDVALYAELAARMPELPDLVRNYLVSAAEGSGGAGGRTWRDLLRLQLDATWAFLQVALDLDPEAGREAFAALDDDGVVLSRR